MRSYIVEIEWLGGYNNIISKCFYCKAESKKKAYIRGKEWATIQIEKEQKDINIKAADMRCCINGVWVFTLKEWAICSKSEF